MSPVKFKFDTAFGDEGGARAPDAHAAEIASLKAEIDAARQAGRQEGRQAGLQEAEATAEARLAGTLNTLVERCEAIAAESQSRQGALHAEATQLAHAIATKLAPALMQAHPLAEIEALVADCLESCRREPRLVVRVPEDLVDALDTRLEALKAAGGYAGRIILMGDPALSGSDGRVEWPDGGTERSRTVLEQEIAEAVRRYVAAAQATDETDGETDGGAGGGAGGDGPETDSIAAAQDPDETCARTASADAG